MEFHDIVLDGKPLRIWNRQGAGQVAPQQRQPLHHRYDAEQWVQRVQHLAPEHLPHLCTLAGLTDTTTNALIDALHRGELIIGPGHGSGSKAMGDAQAAQRWRAKQAAPPPLISPSMQSALAALAADSGALVRSMVSPGTDRTAAALISAPGQKTGTDETRQWHCLFEVAGRNHFGSQRLALCHSPQSAATARNDRQQPHRALVDIAVQNGQPVALAISIATRTGQPLNLPLPHPINPRQKSGSIAAQLDNIIIPVRPIIYRNLQSDPQRTMLPSNGHAYLFWQGQLWRELAVDAQGVMRDIDVSWERQQRAFTRDGNTNTPRKPIGQHLDAIWIPAKLNGQWQTGANGFALAFFPRQLPWEEIDALEQDAALRQRYATALDSLQHYGQQPHFSGHVNHIGALQTALPPLPDSDDPDAVTQNQHHRLLAPYRNNGFAAAYVQPTIKRVSIRLADAYGGTLPSRRFSDGDRVILKGNKEYSAVIRQGQVMCDVDIGESRLTLELPNNCHPKASEPA